MKNIKKYKKIIKLVIKEKSLDRFTKEEICAALYYGKENGYFNENLCVVYYPEQNAADYKFFGCVSDAITEKGEEFVTIFSLKRAVDLYSKIKPW
jgi:hypothetical protein